MSTVEQRMDKLVDTMGLVFNSDKFKIDKVYRSKSITINGSDNDTYVYIRIYQSNLRFKVDISNISLATKIQRKGYFTQLVHEINKLDFVDEIIVSTVLSREMQQACIKNKFKESEEYLGYILRKA